MSVETPLPVVAFTVENKMSHNLIELRIDHHLNRIMKNYRLVNFCNAIKALPVEARICEKLIEILSSSENLMSRRVGQVEAAKDVLVKLRAEVGKHLHEEEDASSKDKLTAMWSRLQEVALHTEQLIWALNSNKEHLRYIARIYLVPDIYKRTEHEVVPLRQQYQNVIAECEHVIEVCKLIRMGLSAQMRAIYSHVQVANGTAAHTH